MWKLESCLRRVPEFLPSKHYARVTDASPVGVNAVLKRKGRSVIYISLKLTVTEQGYSKERQESLAVFWAAKLHQ